jgi:hypothetical protein
VICRICDQDLDIKDALLLDEAKGLLTYRFPDGTVHLFKRQQKKKEQEQIEVQEEKS